MSKWRRLQRAPSAGKIRATGTPESWNCIDCGVNTAPGHPDCFRLAEDFKRFGRSKTVCSDQAEVYCVWDAVWAAAGMESYGGCLCVACLEKRLGRELTPDDFNRDHVWGRVPGTPRLLQRQGRPVWLQDSNWPVALFLKPRHVTAA
jgi:hypothetical protein